MEKSDSSSAIMDFEFEGETYKIASLKGLEKDGLCELDKLPVSIRILIESVLRNIDGEIINFEDVKNATSWAPETPDVEVPFSPSRVVLQDLTGVPAVVDLAALRSAAHRAGKDPSIVEPAVPCDLVIDHSVQVDFFGSEDAYERNVEMEYERNGERYRSLKWAQQAFSSFRVVPPGTGIVHQVNLEYLGQVVHSRSIKGDQWLLPDTLVGTDSHTPMIGGIGVVGWGVGGIEAEAAMLGQPITMTLPEVVGVRLTGELPQGATATDLVLYLVEILREVGVVDRFVEFFGPAVKTLSVPDRATISNMAPEQGSTISVFPVDDVTLEYLRLTGRDEKHIRLVEAYLKEQGLFGEQEPEYTEIVELNLGTIEPSLAGPKRPQDRVLLNDMKIHFEEILDSEVEKGGKSKEIVVEFDGKENSSIGHGSVVVSAITSCTNTSNPTVMVAAGLLAEKAIELGLEIPSHVKTSLAPGSKVVTEYLKESELLEPLEKLGYHVVGYGCTTCIGNAGPLPESVEKAIDENNLWATSVLSGNRNFEARIHPKIRANYLASPPLVVAYGLAGRMDINLEVDPLGKDKNGNPVYLKDVWPSNEEINETVRENLDPSMFQEKYSEVFSGDEKWEKLSAPEGVNYEWDSKSTYIREPPFFQNFSSNPPGTKNIKGARCLLVLGDTVTTDHISPAGPFGSDVPAGIWLTGEGLAPYEFNTYGSRRGNHEVMMRGTFANVRIKNELVPEIEGGYTFDFISQEVSSVYDASKHYQEENIPLIVLAGKEFGAGSSRDWAAKGSYLLGIRATIAESYERIFRDNLVGMGVIPLQFEDGESKTSLGLDGSEKYDIIGLESGVNVGQKLKVIAERGNGEKLEFSVIAQVNTPAAVKYIEHGGILNYVLRRLLA
tara:strand:+ start:7845 stop:10520 length:2676 start_codon:yes stop_codon:yes gene_type:complete